MAGFLKSPFGKRLRTLHDDTCPQPPSNRRRTESLQYGDRFIPSPDGGSKAGRYNLQSGPGTDPTDTPQVKSGADSELDNALFKSVLEMEVADMFTCPKIASRSRTPPRLPSSPRLLSYISPPSTPSRLLNTATSYPSNILSPHSLRLMLSPSRVVRKVGKTPHRVLDAPNIADDFYLNLVDWSSTDVLAVGLGSCVYLWSTHNSAVHNLCDVSDAGECITSVSWVQKGSVLAVGTNAGHMRIYDATRLSLLRTYKKAHARHVGAIAWNGHVLTSGAADHMIHHRDVREASSYPFTRSTGHRKEVCGLKWSLGTGESTANLASGGNDNKVCIWDLRGSARGTEAGGGPGDMTAGSQPLWKFHEHTAAVKALAWDPHLSGVLATGGGAQDTHIRFWNARNGTMLDALHTGSQVCNLTWSPTSHELLSTHGLSSTTAQNQIFIWKYPTLERVASLNVIKTGFCTWL